MLILRRIPYWGVLALLVYMPLHIFLSQSLSLATGGLDTWKLAKDGALFVVLMFTFCLILKQRCTSGEFTVFAWLTAVYVALHALLWAAHPAIFRDSALLGIIYNVRLFGYLLLGLGAALLLPPRYRSVAVLVKVVIGVSTVVAVLGIVQHFLPKDILTHVGYSLERGVRPSFYIDDNAAFPRIMSTLRDPNSLGTYLILPLAFLATQLTRFGTYSLRRKLLFVGVASVHVGALYLTFSRSAWLGALVALAVIGWWQFSSPFVRLLRRWWPACIALVLLSGMVLYSQRHNAVIDGVLTHSTSVQRGEIDSNEYHWLYIQQGLDGIWDKPLGHGPGTAGLASIRDPEGGLLTENYYIQIGYEIGIFGLAVFIAAHVWLYMCLRRGRDMLTVALLATFWAYIVINMLLHIWSNEAVAAQWWLLAGVMLAVPAVRAAGRATKPVDRTDATTRRANA